MVKEKLTTHRDCVKYCERWKHERMSLDKPQWEFRVLEDFKDDESVMFLRINHVFCDGMALTCLFAYLDDHLDLSKVVDKGRGTFLQRILFYIGLPFFIIKAQYNIQSLRKSTHLNPFVLNEG